MQVRIFRLQSVVEDITIDFMLHQPTSQSTKVLKIQAIPRIYILYIHI